MVYQTSEFFGTPDITKYIIKFHSTKSKRKSVPPARGAEGRGEQRRGLRTKASMRDLGTRLACRHRVFVRTGKTLWK